MSTFIESIYKPFYICNNNQSERLFIEKSKGVCILIGGKIKLKTADDVVNIELQIKIKREEMIAVARKTGFTSEETLQISQELDKLINEYQRFFLKKKKNSNIKLQNEGVKEVRKVQTNFLNIAHVNTNEFRQQGAFAFA